MTLAFSVLMMFLVTVDPINLPQTLCKLGHRFRLNEKLPQLGHWHFSYTGKSLSLSPALWG